MVLSNVVERSGSGWVCWCNPSSGAIVRWRLVFGRVSGTACVGTTGGVDVTTPGRASVGVGVEEELGQRVCVVCFVGVGVVVLFGGGW